ncbi:Beta-galactosidase 3 [Capsicum annuum]|uniref:beta-galactosidase n=1 Tax=Capsicum annuum TaxID=4072 RepID=A0A2G3A522_CAPAN|nr:Beta-galactosidase 3 [Capsicum annuum]
MSDISILFGGKGSDAEIHSEIVELMKSENLFGSQGGPIILSHIENEYQPAREALGKAGEAYVQWAAHMAVGLNTGDPRVMCKEDDASDPIINTCNGFYCDEFSPNKPYKPTMWTEAWSGWFAEFVGTIPMRQVQDLAFAVARFIQKCGSFVNYYMAHVFSSGKGSCVAFLSNYDSNSAARVVLNNKHFNLPPWSISILPNYSRVAFNTAKVRHLHNCIAYCQCTLFITFWLSNLRHLFLAKVGTRTSQVQNDTNWLSAPLLGGL